MTARESQDLPRRIADLGGQDAYELLGVTPEAAADEVVAAYRREMARAHPDRGGTARRAQAVNCAFDVLTRHREDYDELTGRLPLAAGPGVLFVAPDGGPLDEPAPPRAAIWRPLLALALAGAVVVTTVVLGATVIQRLGARSSSAQPAPWTASQVGAASEPAALTSGAAAAPLPTRPAVAAPAETWSVPSRAATVVVVSASATGADGGHRCEVRADRSLWCGGANAQGQVGNGSNRDVAGLVRVGADAAWAAVAAGGQTTCGLHADGSLWCWGDNRFGQVGDGTNSARSTPVPVEPQARWVALDVDTHVCAVRADHTLWCWGAGGQGELGDGGQVDWAMPVRPGIPEDRWTSVSVGAGWTCGARQDGAEQCWGVRAPR